MAIPPGWLSVRGSSARTTRAAFYDAAISGVEPQLEGLTRLAERPGVLAAQEHAALGEVLRVDREELLHGVELHPDQQINRSAWMPPPLLLAGREPRTSLRRREPCRAALTLGRRGLGAADVRQRPWPRPS